MHQIDPAEKVPPPRVLSGRYRLDALLAQSGSGEVHLATQLGLERKVAVKLISKTDDQDWGELVARLSREAQVLARLNHINVVTLHDFGKTEDGDFFLTMEYLDGRPLAELIETQGPFAFDRILRIGVQVARALREAHAVGVIHRDLTAEDVFLVRGADENDRDHVKVINFGLAETAGGKSGLEVVGDGAKILLGSPSYVSPEQICGDRATERSDIYAFGVLMYLMLTGRVPFSGGSQAELQRAHLKDAPPPPSLMGYRRRVPRALEELVYRCLEKEPEDRFSDARSLILALKAVYWAIDPSHSVDGTPKERSISGSMGPRLDPDFGSDDLAAITAELTAAPIPGIPNPTLPPFGARAPRDWTIPNAPLPPPPRAEPPSAPVLDDLPLLVPPSDKAVAVVDAPAPRAPVAAPVAAIAPSPPAAVAAPAPHETPVDGPRRLLPLALVGGAVILGVVMLLLRPAPSLSPSSMAPPSAPAEAPARSQRPAPPPLDTTPAPSLAPALEPVEAEPAAPAAAAEGLAPEEERSGDRAAPEVPTAKKRRGRAGNERATTPEEERPAEKKVDAPPAPAVKPEKTAPAPKVAPESQAPAIKPVIEAPVPQVPVAPKAEAAKVIAPAPTAAPNAAPNAPAPQTPEASAPAQSPAPPAPKASAPAPQPAPPAPKVEVLVPAQPIKNVLPSYPERYVSSGYSAVVTLKVNIDEAGVPTGVEIIEPARFPEFNTAAKKAAMAERYRPATRDGKPVPYLRTTRYNFAAP